MVHAVVNPDDFPVGSVVRIRRKGSPDFGTVMMKDGEFVGVMFNESFPNGNDLDGLVPYGMGYWFSHGIEVYEPTLKEQLLTIWEPLL